MNMTSSPGDIPVHPECLLMGQAVGLTHALLGQLPYKLLVVTFPRGVVYEGTQELGHVSPSHLEYQAVY